MLSKKIKQLRESTGKSARAFAEEIGLKYTTYYGYETGTREPGSDVLRMLADIFGVTVDYLLDRSDDPKGFYTVHPERKWIPSPDEIAEKYRSLDRHGKETVNLILDREIARMKSIKERDERIAELESKQNPSEAYTLSIAARDGGDTVVLETPEERESRREATLRDLETIPDFSFDE